MQACQIGIPRLPVATVAYYGPNDQRASKVAVGHNKRRRRGGGGTPALVFIAKMKDGRTHLAHKAEHAVDLETGAMVAVTLQGCGRRRHHPIVETALAAAEQIEDAPAGVTEPGRSTRSSPTRGITAIRP